MNIVNIGIVGFAHPHVHRYLSLLLDRSDARVLGGWDEDARRAATVLEPAGLTVFDTPRALLSSAIDAVVICSENARRAEWTIAAARAGKHILCENPLGVSLQDVDDMIRACREAGVRLMTAFPYRYLPAVREAKRAVARGDIGTVLALKGSCRGKLPEGWFADPFLAGGGVVMEHGVLVADLMRWLTNDEPDAVYAEIGRWSDEERAVEDTALIHAAFGGGWQAVLDISWSSGATPLAPGSLTIEIIGTDGMIGIDFFAQANELYRSQGALAESSYWGDRGDEELFEDFIHTVRSGHPAPTTGEDGRAAAAVALAAYESARSGIPVSLERRRDETMLSIGTAKVDITPSRPVPLGGFASRMAAGAFEGISHPLYARILCFEHSDADGLKTSAVLVSADLLWWGSQMVEPLKRRIREHWPADTVILHGTHTHSGPQIWDGFSVYGGSVDPAYIAELEATVLQGIDQAISDMEPVSVEIGNGQCDIATNRRSRGGNQVQIASNEKGPADRKLTIVRYKSTADDRVKAVLVHYACHPVVTAENLVSSEFTGVAMEQLERSIGDGAICAYLQGTCGDINPNDADMGADAQVVMLGNRLADDVNKVLTGTMRRVGSVNLRSIRMSVALPLQALPERDYLESLTDEPGVMGEWSRKLLSRREGIPASMSLEMTGLALAENFNLLAMNAEVVVEYGLYLKSISNQAVVPIAYSDGMIGYIPTARQLEEGGYEPIDSTYYFGLPAPFAPATEARLKEALNAAVRELCDAKQQ